MKDLDVYATATVVVTLIGALMFHGLLHINFGWSLLMGFGCGVLGCTIAYIGGPNDR